MRRETGTAGGPTATDNRQQAANFQGGFRTNALQHHVIGDKPDTNTLIDAKYNSRIISLFFGPI
jgi:hypothetical protein